MHIYQRKINLDGTDSLSRIALAIPANSEVLDVGTGTGALGEFLSSQRNCQLDGVNYNSEEIALARPFYRELHVANLEQTPLSQLFSNQRYDFIVFADVLEHLRNPAQILSDARQLLKPSGRAIISLPNIAYSGVIADLLAGQFNYTEEGILDQTHVQFFTRDSLYQLLCNCGFKPTLWDQITRQPGESEFRHRYPDSLPPPLWQALSTNPDALTYQFIVEAVANDAAVAEATMPAQLPPEFGFMVQVYWSGLSGSFNEVESAKTIARLGEVEQTLHLPLPTQTLNQLRIDPADRPGTLKLWSLSIIDGNANPIWQWNGRPDAFTSSGLFAIANGFAEPGATLALLDNDPNITFQLNNLTLPTGCQVELKLSWPASNDTLALSHAYQQWTDAQQQRQLQLQHQFSALEQALQEAQKFVQAREQDISQLQTQLEYWQSQHAQLQQNHNELQLSHNELQLSHNELQLSHNELQLSHNELQLSHNELQLSHNELQLSHNELQLSHNELQLSHNELQQQYQTSIDKLQELQRTATAEKQTLTDEIQLMKRSRSWRYTRFLRKE